MNKLPQTVGLFVLQRKERCSDRKAGGESSLCWPNRSVSLQGKVIWINVGSCSLDNSIG